MRTGVVWLLATGVLLVSGCGTSPRNDAHPLMPSLDPIRIEPSIVPSAIAPVPEASPPPVSFPYPYSTPGPLKVAPNEIAGYVLSEGKGIGGIRLSLINNGNWDTRSLVTAPDGSYRASGLPEGVYFVHYYNDSDNGKIGFWKSPNRKVGPLGANFPAIEVFLVGMKNTPGQGAGVGLPFQFHWTPYPLGKSLQSLRFRVHDAGGPGGKALFISERLPGDTLSFSYDGTINQAGWSSKKLEPGRRYLWGIFYDAGDAGEGGNLYQDFVP